MKKIFKMFVAVIAVAVLTACGTAVQPTDFKVNPNPLAVVGDKVDADITGTFPVKKFGKKAILTVTPVLKYDVTEVAGQAVTYVGEKAKENGSTVSYKEGGKFKMHASFDYVPAMDKCELYLRFTAKNGKKVVEIPETKVADGLVATAKLIVSKEVKSQVTPDAFQRIIAQKQEADVKFLIQQANLRNSEWKSADVKNLLAAIEEVNAAVNKEITNIEVAGYASPDGTENLNTKLATKRQENAQKKLQRELKKIKVTTTVDSEITAEDWAYFQALVEASNIQGKKDILSILKNEADPEKREDKIKDLGVVYEELATAILPELRRSRLILNYNLIGKSDEEIAALAQNDPAALNVEELLYAATLTSDLNEKVELYKKAVAQFADDYRSHNNLGMIYYSQGKIDEAGQCFAKALQLAANNADVNYNAALVALAKNDLAKAEAHLAKANGTEGNLNVALGTLYVMKGDYAAAKKALGNATGNNAAVLHILLQDYAAARKALANVETPNATTAYLLAIVGARTNNPSEVYANLEVAAKCANLKVRAQNDIEFAKYQNDEKFQAIVK